MSLSRYLKQDTDKKKKAPKTNFHITDNNLSLWTFVLTLR